MGIIHPRWCWPDFFHQQSLSVSNIVGIFGNDVISEFPRKDAPWWSVHAINHNGLLDHKFLKGKRIEREKRNNKKETHQTRAWRVAKKMAEKNVVPRPLQFADEQVLTISNRIPKVGRVWSAPFPPQVPRPKQACWIHWRHCSWKSGRFLFQRFTAQTAKAMTWTAA